MNPWSVLDRIFGWGGVLAYHGVGPSPHTPVMHVSPERLREQLAYLRSRYHVLALSELVTRWQRGQSTRDCVAITFDDAYVGVVELAGPILRDLEVPATLFVSTEFSRLAAAFWWDVAELDRLGHAGAPWQRMPSLVGLDALPSDDANAMAMLRERVLAANEGRWVQPLVPAAAATPWRAASFAELREFARNPLIEFGVHTVTHPALPMLSREMQVQEIRECHRRMQDAGLPRVLPVLAYPYGLYDRTSVEAAREAGMSAACTIEGRAASARPSMYTIPRVGAGELHAPTSLERRLSRALRPALVIRNGGRHPRVPVRAVLDAPVITTPNGAVE